MHLTPVTTTETNHSKELYLNGHNVFLTGEVGLFSDGTDVPVYGAAADPIAVYDDNGRYDAEFSLQTFLKEMDGTVFNVSDVMVSRNTGSVEMLSVYGWVQIDRETYWEFMARAL
jgi:hypothetical protein